MAEAPALAPAASWRGAARRGERPSPTSESAAGNPCALQAGVMAPWLHPSHTRKPRADAGAVRPHLTCLLRAERGDIAKRQERGGEYER